MSDGPNNITPEVAAKVEAVSPVTKYDNCSPFQSTVKLMEVNDSAPMPEIRDRVAMFANRISSAIGAIGEANKEALEMRASSVQQGAQIPATERAR